MCACKCNNGAKSQAAGWEGAGDAGREAHQQKPRRTYSTCPRDAGSTRPRSRPPESPRWGTLAELWASRSDHSLWPDELRKEGNGSATITPASRGLYPAGAHICASECSMDAAAMHAGAAPPASDEASRPVAVRRQAFRRPINTTSKRSTKLRAKT